MSLPFITFLCGVAITLLIRWIDSMEREIYFNLEAKEKLKLAVIEKRLEAHQKALEMWYNLYYVINNPDPDKIKLDTIRKARNFWISNVIYLEKETRKDFDTAILIASYYHIWRKTAREETDPSTKKKDTEYYLSQWDSFMEVNNTIQKEVKLEPINPVLDKDAEGNKIPIEKKD